MPLLLGTVASSYLQATSSYESIATATGGSGFFEFTNIPQTYAHLQIRGIANNGESSGWNNQQLRINSDAGSTYAFHIMYASAGTASAANYSSTTSVNDVFRVPPTSSSSYSGFTIDIVDYSKTNKFKVLRCLNGGANNSNGWIQLTSGLWRSNDAVTSIRINSSVGNFGSNSSCALYGIKAA
jgi:hypothetical protein